MADKIPIRGGFNGGSLTGLAQFASGDTLGVAHGGTGVVTIGSNALVTGNGTSAMTSESNLTFDGTILKSTGDLCATVKVVAPALCIGSEYVLPTADGSAGQLMCTDGSGAIAFATASGGVTLAGSTNNTIATVTGSDALAGEANLTFDGSTLNVIGNAGVGIARTEGTLHVHTATAGSVTADVDADDLIIEGSTHAGISILTPNDKVGSLLFGDPDSNSKGAFSYDHGADAMRFNTGGSERMRLVGGSLGIGTTAPDHIFHAQDVGANSFNTKAVFDLENTRRAGYTQATLELASEYGTPGAGNFRTAAIAAELIGNQTATDIVFYDESTERMRITSAGYVGIGAMIPDKLLTLEESSTTAFNPDSTTGILHLRNVGTDTDQQWTGITMSVGSGGGNGQTRIDTIHRGTGSEADLSFSTRASNGSVYERMVIESTGRIEGYSNPVGNSAMHLVQSAGSNAFGINVDFSAFSPNNTTQWVYRFEDSTTARYIVYSDGSVQGSANSYGGISDVRLKQDITDVRSYWDDFKDVRFRKYKLKTDVEQFGENAQSYFGVVAQEMESIFPALITESPDTKQQNVPVLDSDGNPVNKLDDEGNPIPITESKLVDLGTTTKGFKYSILSQIGLKVVQELQTRFEAAEKVTQELQTRLEAAEAEITILKG